MVTDPDSATPPATGATEAQGGTDVSGRPMFPALFITDLSVPPGSSNELAGDWQYGGTGTPPTEIYGTWKAATKTINNNTVTVTPDADPAANNWNLGPGADPVPPGLTNQGYGIEVRWDISSLHLTPGHRYRVYFMVHDGDQNKTGGDSGQGCGYFTMPGTPPPTPTASPTPTATATASPTPTPTPTCAAAATLVASASPPPTDGKTVTTTSFTLKANTTYLVFAFTDSNTGDSATFSSTFSGSPTFNNIGSGSAVLAGDGNEYEFGRWLNGGASDATGTITVTFVESTKQAYLHVVQLCGNDTSAPIAQNAYATGNNTNPYTANLPAPPLVGTNFDVYFLCGKEDLGGMAPVGTPAVTNYLYEHAGPGSAGTYFKNTPSQNESFAGANKHWGTIAVEIKRP